VLNLPHQGNLSNHPNGYSIIASTTAPYPTAWIALVLLDAPEKNGQPFTSPQDNASSNTE